MTVSLITLGSLSSNELAQTSTLLPFANRIVNQWIFVLFHLKKSQLFFLLHAYSLSLDQFDVSLTYCSNGISNSLNEGLSCVKCSWTLIVHSGDSLIDLDESSYSILSTVLSDPLQSNVLQIFGSLYDNGFGKMSITNHQRSATFESMMPWIPHESTFVPSVYYLLKIR